MSQSVYIKRGRKTGIKHHRAKVSKEHVIEIRRLREKKGKSLREIGETVGHSMWTVRDICEYRTRVLE